MRITNTRTGRTVAAKSGRDLADMVKIELDRRTGIELTEAERKADMSEANRQHREAMAS